MPKNTALSGGQIMSIFHCCSGQIKVCMLWIKTNTQVSSCSYWRFTSLSHELWPLFWCCCFWASRCRLLLHPCCPRAWESTAHGHAPRFITALLQLGIGYFRQDQKNRQMFTRILAAFDTISLKSRSLHSPHSQMHLGRRQTCRSLPFTGPLG